jgi:hypothetical protein
VLPSCEPLVELHFNSFQVEAPRPMRPNRVSGRCRHCQLSASDVVGEVAVDACTCCTLIWVTDRTVAGTG